VSGTNLFDDTIPVRLPLPEDTRLALIEKGITPPDHVLLLLRQATPRELQQLAHTRENLPSTGPEVTAWLLNMLRRRASEGTDDVVLQELVKDLTPTSITMLTFAYTEGRLPNPKEKAALLEQMAQWIAAQSPAPAPSSRTSTTSTKKRSKTSRRSTSRT